MSCRRLRRLRAPSTSRSSSPTTRPPGSARSSRSTRPPSARRSAAPASTRTPRPPTRSRDVLNLSRGMSYKAALAGLDLGGGKAVIIGDPATREVRGAAARLRPLRPVARRPLLHRLRRRHLLGRHGRHRPRVRRSSPAARSRTAAPGDSSVLTAYGVFQGMRAAAPGRLGHAPRSPGRTVGVAGVGKVGHHLVRHLVEDGAAVVVTDVYAPAARAGPRRAPRASGSWRPTAELVASPLDVYAPCALGGALTDEVVEVLQREDRLRRRQQPARPPRDREGARGARHPLRARLLRQRRRPDPGRRRARGASRFERAQQRATGIFDTTLRVFELAASDGVPPAIAADRLAERRMREVGRLRGIWLG